LTQIEEAYY